MVGTVPTVSSPLKVLITGIKTQSFHLLFVLNVLKQVKIISLVLYAYICEL